MGMIKYSIILVVLFLSSLAMANQYWLNKTGAKWTNLANWSNDGDPNTLSVYYIGAPPSSPTDAWVLLDSNVPDANRVYLAYNGNGRLDIANGADLFINTGFYTAVEASSVATLNVTGGFLDAQGVAPGPWAVDGVMNYKQTGGYVIARINHCAINSGSALNIEVTGGVLNLSGQNPQEEDPNGMPTPVAGQLNMDIDGDGYVMLHAVNPATDTNIQLNGNGMISVRGDYANDPTLGGIVTSKGVLKAKLGYYTTSVTRIYVDPKCVTPVPGDLNDDCSVNLEDFAIFASNWTGN
jgi:hypothetical protein